LHIWGEPPTVPIETKICVAGNLADVINQSINQSIYLATCAKCQDDIFRGYNFTRGRISHFPIDFCMALQQCSANSASALPVISLGLGYGPRGLSGILTALAQDVSACLESMSAMTNAKSLTSASSVLGRAPRAAVYDCLSRYGQSQLRALAG